MIPGLRLGATRLLSFTCTCIASRNATRFTANEEGTHETKELNRPRDQHSTHDSVIFPINNLPIDLLLKVIEQLVLLYLDHPRRACMRIPEILALRLVDLTWSTEVLVAFHRNVTYPNLPLSLFPRFIPSTSPCASQRRAAFASALYNSTLSLHNRHLGCTLAKSILSCAAYAQSLPLPENLTRKETIQRLCTAASQNTKYLRRPRRLLPERTSFSPGQSSHYDVTCGPYLNSAHLDHRIAMHAWQDNVPTESQKSGLREADRACTLVIMGMEDEAIHMVHKLASVPCSEVFGRLDCVARRWGRTRLVTWLEKKNK